MKESKTALGRYLNLSGIVSLCQGIPPRTLFVRLCLNLLRYYQAFEMDIHLKHRMAFNADGQAEFNPDGTKFPDSDFVKLDRDTQKSRNRFLKRFYTDGERLGALERARAYVTTAEFVKITTAVTELRDSLGEHQLAISRARENKPDWFDAFISDKAPLAYDNWWPAWDYVKSYSDSFFRYNLNRSGLDNHSNTRDAPLGIKSNLPQERVLREAKTRSHMEAIGQDLWRYKLGEAMKILDKQWKEVKSAEEEMDKVIQEDGNINTAGKYF